ncbi:threonine/serine exporter family protein [Aspergillus saccharolyticus JOP 1030-1]|uniref:Putative pheromone-regulated membrane protein n=1 Tax=Aspergillus saccharolyticus JOP 1030-1 TaxID=1450539 RepID=A0A318ZYT2_9EURO|nr:putative pheromone-regulated membrane protein [Aspergillus saccharolyticus JOP 1030-1]PYH49360.1 putative pheromone-regulated membrane protein [Aspergillus saccharolyticus JOP 1030-1]
MSSSTETLDPIRSKASSSGPDSHPADDHLGHDDADERPLTGHVNDPSSGNGGGGGGGGGSHQWGVLFKAIKEGTSQLAEKLGRNPDGGDGLDSAWHPEDFGYQEDIEMREMLAPGEGGGEDSYASQLQSLLGADASLLVSKLGLGSGQGMHHRTAEEAAAEKEADMVGGVLWHLLGHQMGHDPEQPQPISGATTPAAQDEEDALGPLPSEVVRKRRKKKWYDEADRDPRSAKERKKAREARLAEKIGSLLTRQRYLMQLCRVMMKCGAPTHRLEEYMQMSAFALRVHGQFLYIPGCMIISFDDPLTRTAEVKLVRIIQGCNLGRLGEVHNCYKNVLHGKLSAAEALPVLDDILTRQSKWRTPWMMVLVAGFISVAVGPWAFGARPIDMPIIFVLGLLMGFMQYILAPRSALYSNVMEVTVAMLISFLARAFGSIRHNGEYLFCFPAMTQSAIALILPGYSVLCSSLELQSHQITAGSIRLVYTIIYSLFLGYGVTVGLTIYGLMDDHATEQTSCTASSQLIYGNTYVQHFVFQIIYVAFAGIVSQARLRQLPFMCVLGLSGYVANYFATTYLSSQMASIIGSFTIGLLANLYSRVWHGHAAAVIVPGMWTLVSSGLASSGSIVAGLQYARAVKEGTTNTSSNQMVESLLSLGVSMVQTALGITVGLFLSALVVYPGGKRQGGLFNL